MEIKEEGEETDWLLLLLHWWLSIYGMQLQLREWRGRRRMRMFITEYAVYANHEELYVELRLYRVKWVFSSHTGIDKNSTAALIERVGGHFRNAPQTHDGGRATEANHNGKVYSIGANPEESACDQWNMIEANSIPRFRGFISLSKKTSCSTRLMIEDDTYNTLGMSPRVVKNNSGWCNGM